MTLVGETLGEENVIMCGFHDPLDFMDFLDSSEDAELIILDTRLGEYDGIEIARKAQERNGNLDVIFISQHYETVFDSYCVRHLYFLQKPISVRKFREAMMTALRSREEKEEKFITLYSKGMISRIATKDIRYIDSNLRVITAHSIGGDTESYGKLENIIPLLDSSFLHCHKSYIVNMNYIERMEGREFILRDGEIVKISPKRFRYSKDAYIRFLANRSQTL